MKSQATQMEIHKMVQAVVDQRKASVHQEYGLEGHEHRAEVILHSALVKYQADPDFTKKMEKINASEQRRMMAAFEN